MVPHFLHSWLMMTVTLSHGQCNVLESHLCTPHFTDACEKQCMMWTFFCRAWNRLKPKRGQESPTERTDHYLGLIRLMVISFEHDLFSLSRGYCVQTFCWLQYHIKGRKKSWHDWSIWFHFIQKSWKKKNFIRGV